MIHHSVAIMLISCFILKIEKAISSFFRHLVPISLNQFNEFNKKLVYLVKYKMVTHITTNTF